MNTRLFHLVAATIAAVLGSVLIVPAGPASADGAQYHLWNLRSGLCVRFEPNPALVLAKVATQNTCPGETFRLEYDFPTGGYRFYVAGSARCLTASHDAEWGNWVGGMGCDGSAAALWRPVHPGFPDNGRLGRLLNQHRLLENVATGECMSVDGHSLEVDTLLITEPCDRDYSQLWYIAPA